MKKSGNESASLKKLERLIALDPQSQAEVAHELKINPTTLSRIKNGRCKPAPKTKYRIMERYHVDENYDPMDRPSPPELKEQPEQYRARPDAEEKAHIVAKLAPELILCLYDYLMKQGRDGSVTVDPGGVIKKSGG